MTFLLSGVLKDGISFTRDVVLFLETAHLGKASMSHWVFIGAINVRTTI
ncbi:hypothetical protein [Tuberibacillus calidus]|nr:hypothetical protein [Tuberibacillus calidus]